MQGHCLCPEQALKDYKFEKDSSKSVTKDVIDEL